MESILSKAADLLNKIFLCTSPRSNFFQFSGTFGRIISFEAPPSREILDSPLILQVAINRYKDTGWSWLILVSFRNIIEGDVKDAPHRVHTRVLEIGSTNGPAKETDQFSRILVGGGADQGAPRGCTQWSRLQRC